MIVSVNEIVEGRNATVDGTGMRLSRTWHVKVDDTSHDATYIYRAVCGIDIPSVRTAHPDVNSLAIAQLVFTCVDPYVWQVEAKYEPTTYGVVPSSQDPWDEPPLINFGSQSSTLAYPFSYGLDFDQTRATAMTSANRAVPDVPSKNKQGQAFEPLPEDEVCYVVVRMVRNFRTLNLNLLEYKNTINNDAITLCGYDIPKFCGWIRTFDVDYKMTQSTPSDLFGSKIYPVATIEVVVNPMTWFKQLVHKGKIKDDGYGQIQLLKDVDGHPIPVDANLDANGVPLAPNAPPIMVNIHTKWELSWASLVPDIIPDDNPESLD